MGVYVRYWCNSWSLAIRHSHHQNRQWLGSQQCPNNCRSTHSPCQHATEHRGPSPALPIPLGSLGASELDTQTLLICRKRQFYDTQNLALKSPIKMTKLCPHYWYCQQYWWFCDRNLYIQLNKLLFLLLVWPQWHRALLNQHCIFVGLFLKNETRGRKNRSCQETLICNSC